jgi:two-component system sensor histidine kinase ChvG
VSAPTYAGSEKPETRDSLLYRGGAAAYRLWRRLVGEGGVRVGPAVRQGSGRIAEGVDRTSPLPEVREALAGRYGAATRLTPNDPRVFTLHSAIPVRGGASGREVIGAVLVSQSTHRILTSLVEVRDDILRVFLMSVAAAVVLSLLVSATIARPLRTLREEANALLDGRGRLRGRFTASDRQDEIGHLTRALDQLTRRLDGHLRFTESFAADVSHELKNPLATIRTTTEMLVEVEGSEDRRRLAGVAQREVARMERLLSGMREITEIDAHLEAEPSETVDLEPLLRQVVESVRLREGRTAVELIAASPVRVSASPERLTQVLGNVLDNAASFSPPGGRVAVTLDQEGGAARVTVEDQGPGIPDAHLDRIFERFFSYRPGEARNGHTGLGLAIVKAIVEGYGGSVAAYNRPEGGARFEIRLPAG